MKPYLSLVKDILANGEVRKDRTGVGTLSLFGAQCGYDLQQGFPLVTTKKVNFSAVVKELVWFLSGSTNKDELGCGIWDEWARPNGDLGPIYGHQWRNWGGTRTSDGTVPESRDGIDQIEDLINGLKYNPYSRRHIVSAWNVADISEMGLPPCHLMFQFYVRSNTFLDCQLYQRSADIALGVPFNIASYALLTHILAQECGYQPGRFIHTFGDVHAYQNHVEGLKEQVTRKPYPLPTIKIANKGVFELTPGDITLENYYYHPAIKFSVAV